MVIQIQISDEVWKYLKQEKKIRETFDDVLRRILKLKAEEKEKLHKGGNKKNVSKNT